MDGVAGEARGACVRLGVDMAALVRGLITALNDTLVHLIRLRSGEMTVAVCVVGGSNPMQNPKLRRGLERDAQPRGHTRLHCVGTRPVDLPGRRLLVCRGERRIVWSWGGELSTVVWLTSWTHPRCGRGSGLTARTATAPPPESLERRSKQVSTQVFKERGDDDLTGATQPHRQAIGPLTLPDLERVVSLEYRCGLWRGRAQGPGSSKVLIDFRGFKRGDLPSEDS